MMLCPHLSGGIHLRFLICILLSVYSTSAEAQQDSRLAQAVRRYAALTINDPVSISLPAPNSRLSANLLKTITASPGDGSKGLGPGPSERTPVEITARAGASVARLKEAIESAGGAVTTVFGPSLFAELPPASLALISGLPAVYSISEQAQFSSIEVDRTSDAQNSPADEGSKGLDVIRAVGVAGLHEKGITGVGTRIGILDFGFQRYDEMIQNGRLPRPFAFRSFNRSGRLDGDKGGSVHGTACAEIVHDLAPGAQLALAATDGRSASILQAANWLISQGVGIISFSAGTTVGPLDGRGWLDQYIEYISKERGILWINSSGNNASAHWTGDASVHDGRGAVLFGPQTRDKLFIVADRKDLSIDIVWDDWGPDPLHPSGTQVLSASLYRIDDGKEELLTQSTFSPGKLSPIIHFSHAARLDETYVVRIHALKVDRHLRVHVFAGGGRVEPSVAEGSLAIPATSKSSLTVGAVNIRTGIAERYSARGPTDDGRPKPDLSAYDSTTSLVYAQGFLGTSAACPAAAGLAALIRQLRPGLRGAPLKDALLQYVRPPSEKLNALAYGKGVLDASLVLGNATRGLVPPAPVRAEGMVALPPEMGGHIAYATLDDLASLRSDSIAFSASLAVDRPGRRPVYRYNEIVHLKYSCSVPCRIALLAQSEAGEYTVISAPDLTVEALRNYEFPDIRITPPPGDERFVLVAVSESGNPAPNSPIAGASREIAISVVNYAARP